MPDEPVNCERCAHLGNRAQPGFGVCACAARMEQTGKVRPTVALDATCEHAKISAKFDPEFFPALRLAMRGGWPQPSILEPDQETPQPEIKSDETHGQLTL